MIRNISSFGKILKAEGLGIKSIAQTAFKDKEGAHFVVNLNNGEKGVYTVTRGQNTTRQTLSSNGKVVEYTTKKFPEQGWEVYSKKSGDYVTIPQTQSLSYVKEQGKITGAANYKRTPINEKTYIDPATGQVRHKAFVLQELHADKYTGRSILPEDKLVAADGSKLLPIYQRPMTGGEPQVTKVWNM